MKIKNQVILSRFYKNKKLLSNDEKLKKYLCDLVTENR